MTPGIRHHVLHATHGWRRSPRVRSISPWVPAIMFFLGVLAGVIIRV